MHPVRQLLGVLPQLLVEFRTLSGTGGAVAILSLADRQPRRGNRRAAGQSGRSFPPLSLPHHHELRQYLSQGPEPGPGDRRNQADDGQAEGLGATGNPERMQSVRAGPVRRDYLKKKRSDVSRTADKGLSRLSR